MTKKIRSNLGNTVFEIEDSNTPGVLKIVRTNSDGVTEFFVPRGLVVGYAVQRAEEVFFPKILEALK